MSGSKCSWMTAFIYFVLIVVLFHRLLKIVLYKQKLVLTHYLESALPFARAFKIKAPGKSEKFVCSVQ